MLFFYFTINKVFFYKSMCMLRLFVLVCVYCCLCCFDVAAVFDFFCCYSRELNIYVIVLLLMLLLLLLDMLFLVSSVVISVE